MLSHIIAHWARLCGAGAGLEGIDSPVQAPPTGRAGRHRRSPKLSGCCSSSCALMEDLVGLGLPGTRKLPSTWTKVILFHIFTITEPFRWDPLLSLWQRCASDDQDVCLRGWNIDLKRQFSSLRSDSVRSVNASWCEQPVLESGVMQIRVLFDFQPYISRNYIRMVNLTRG